MSEPAGRSDRSPPSDGRGAARANGDGSRASGEGPEGEARLERAVEGGEFTPHFQPIVSLDSGEMLAAEALARWTPPGDEAVPPAGFMDLAEETGLIHPLGRQVLGSSARLLERWGDAAPARIHVNLSPPEFRNAFVVDALRRAAREHEVHLGRLCVEISERQASFSPGRVRRLRELGVRVALDDFGRGYSSYSLLGTLPITDLKLDASLVRSLDRGRRPRLVVSRIVDTARDLGLRVVAEGVQTATQLDALRKTGCRAGQGHLFGRPLSPEAFGASLDGRPAAPPEEVHRTA